MDARSIVRPDVDGHMDEAGDALDAARRQARTLVADLQAELDGIIAAQEADPPDDEHDVEGSSVGFERARVTALLVRAEARLAELELAGARLEAGDYGRCAVCRGDIAADRLAALPATTRCFACASA